MTEENVAMTMAESWGMLRPVEVQALKKIAKDLPKNAVMVNLGAGFGTSSLAVAEERKDVTIHTFDIRVGGPLGGLENERNAFKRAGIPHPIQVLSDSSKAGREWNKPKVHFVFVDAGHQRQNVIDDIEAWLPNVRYNGLIGFHDYDSKNWKWVKAVIDEMLGDYPTVLLEDTVIVKRNRPPKK